jgi:rhodanese-related sulfurtransferase
MNLPIKTGMLGVFGVTVVAVGGWLLVQRLHTSDLVITPAEVQKLMESDTNHVILDVRTEGEFNGDTGHLRGALLIPVQTLNERMSELAPLKSKLIIAVCRSGNRSGIAVSMLSKQGYKALNMTGGMIQWNRESRPVVHEEKQ